MQLFEIFATVGLKSDQFNRDIDAAAKKGESFGANVGKIFSKVGQVAAVGLGAAATAFTGLSVKALQFTGELEQNVGGAEAVFAEFAEDVEQKGSKAFKNMGVSASDFMATANKMGALMQGSGIDIETSMELSTRAMQRAADVASIMGIDTASAMESIAGAAKGNFTISNIVRHSGDAMLIAGERYQRCAA